MESVAQGVGRRIVPSSIALIIGVIALFWTTLQSGSPISESLGNPSDFSRPDRLNQSTEKFDTAAIGEMLRSYDVLKLDNSPHDYRCDRAAGLCISGIDAANFKMGCITGDAVSCQAILSVLALECNAGMRDACAAVDRLGPRDSDIHTAGTSKRAWQQRSSLWPTLLPPG